MLEVMLSTAQRFDNVTSMQSDPLRTLIEAINGLSVGRIYIPTQVWRTVVARTQRRSNSCAGTARSRCVAGDGGPAYCWGGAM